MTVPYAEVIGDPVDHSKSPLIHKFWLGKLGLDYDYRATRVAADELDAYFAQRRADPLWRGCNVTMPHKVAVLAKLDHLMPEARRTGAVNTIARLLDDEVLMGINTDWYGVDLALPSGAADGKDVVLIGAGGAARGAMEALRLAKPRSLTILNRDKGKAAGLLRQFGMEGAAETLQARLPAADLLINASALGMSGYPPLDLDLSAIRDGGVVADMVYDPVETALLRQARNRGLQTIDGLAILIWQASMAFRFFFKAGYEEPDSPELRELLAS
jgi:shikimate dehydrogenase